MRNKMTLVVAALTSALALAQNPNTPKTPKDEGMLVTSEQMSAILAKAVAPDTGKPAGISARLMDGGSFSTAFIRLIAPDHPHAHGTWSEIFIVREGSGTLETGGELACPCTGDSAIHKAIFADKQPATQGPPQTPKPGTPHDGSADAITGGTKQHVKAGDIVLVPQGVPHTWTAVDQPVVYLDIKFH